MKRAEKTAFVEEIRQNIAGTPLVVLTDFKGSTVAQMEQLRRACEPAGLSFRVVKNTLTRRAIDGTGMEGLSPFLKGNTGLLLSGEDPIAAAKLIREESKKNEKLIIKAGFFEGDVLDAKGVALVADLPSREELLTMLLRTVQEAPRQVLGVLQAPARDLLFVLNNFSSKLEED